ncbi:NADH-ubiquinone oxidoreductase chain G [hydrothermal vent metagenome]|uniref:NADH-ubiquinone oxidoreductase chain G n=1 Tax=hydrothermal vent metagenome TaxID=652676 RepID=A0A3B1AKV5_9ZZZZ
MVNIEINGQAIEAEDGSMVIQAADAVGITIPRFCYHKKLSVAANCRMCLVEVEKAPKPMPACATPVTEGMKIYTQSKKAIEAQKSVMEFLLINHPLDCPICDQGGECELQDIAMGYGKSSSRFNLTKRVVPSKNLGSLIATDMTRCIHCTRCVRFGQEIAGIMELGATGRGEFMKIGTYIEKAVSSELSGNVIDLCPVGALTSKPYRFHGRPWDNTQINAISPHDCIGSNISIEVCRNKVRRVLPRDNESINESWISDRDRFSYEALEHEQRLTTPMIKQGNEWKAVDWQTALNYAVEGIKTIINKDGADSIGSLISPSATIEEMALLQKLTRALGSNNIDHRLRQSDFELQNNVAMFPALGMALEDIDSLNAILLVGSNIRKDQPMIAHRIRKASKQFAKVMLVNSCDYDFNFPTTAEIICSPAQTVIELAAILKALSNKSSENTIDAEIDKLIKNVSIEQRHSEIAEALIKAENAAVMLGTQAIYQAEYSVLNALATQIAKLSNAHISILTEGCNSSGAWMAGCVPHRLEAGQKNNNIGLNALQMTSTGRKAFFLFGVEPELDCIASAQALAQMNDAEFVVSMTAYSSDAMKNYADVILPITPFTETSGSYVNIEGVWQSFNGSVTPLGDARPGWKVLRVFGNLFELNDFEYLSSEEIRDELKTKVAAANVDVTWQSPKSLPSSDDKLTRIAYTAIYDVDGTVRRSKALHETQDAVPAALYLNTKTAQKNNLSDDEDAVIQQNKLEVILPVIIDDGVPDNCVLTPIGMEATNGLSQITGAVELRKA